MNVLLSYKLLLFFSFEFLNADEAAMHQHQHVYATAVRLSVSLGMLVEDDRYSVAASVPLPQLKQLN